MQSNETVCAVVVTYNRKELLIKCLEALERQTRLVNAIYIVDNASTDQTPELLQKKGYVKEIPSNTLQKPGERTLKKNGLLIHYVRMHENTGGAGGFYEGVKRAYEKDYEWVWLMDDDATPQKTTLKELSRYFKEENVSALAGVVKDPENKILKKHRGYLDFNNIFPIIQKPLAESEYNKSSIIAIDFASFVGIIINRKSIQKIGFPKKEFFYQHDDVEYCIRLSKTGKILLVTASIIYHPKDEITIENFYGRSIEKISFNRFKIAYFGIRNLIWIGKIYNTNKKFYFDLIKNYIKTIALILFFYDHKFKRTTIITNAYIDGLNDNFDNDKPQKLQ